MKAPETTEPPLLKQAELAARLKVTTRAIQLWRKAGRIPHIRLGPRIVRYRWSEVEAALTKLTKKAS